MMDIDEWQTLGRLQVACASVSVCMLTFLCAYYIANPNCRKRKKIFELCGVRIVSVDGHCGIEWDAGGT